MVTLITVEYSSGLKRRCDSRCYNSRTSKCTCVCGGRNHGKGLPAAVDNTREISALLRLQAKRTGMVININAEIRKMELSRELGEGR